MATFVMDIRSIQTPDAKYMQLLGTKTKEKRESLMPGLLLGQVEGCRKTSRMQGF